MFAVSNALNLHSELHLVLHTLPQHVLVCLHLTKMNTHESRKPFSNRR